MGLCFIVLPGHAHEYNEDTCLIMKVFQEEVLPVLSSQTHVLVLFNVGLQECFKFWLKVNVKGENHVISSIEVWIMNTFSQLQYSGRFL